MMHIENLKTELHKQGIDIEDVTVVKNGIKCRGFKVLTDPEDTVCPVVYFSEEDAIAEISEKILAVCAARPQFDVEKLMDWDYVKDHVFIGVQRRDAESDICRRECLNLDIILRIYVDIDHLADKIGTIKVSEALVKTLGISEDDREFYSLFNENYREEVFRGLRNCDGDFYRRNVDPLYGIILSHIV